MKFTLEQEADIRAAYRDAKNPNKQIGILADLYACSTSDIKEVLGLNKSPKRTVQSYNQATKNQLVKAVIVDGQSLAAASEQFGIPFSTAAGWVTAARKKQKEFLDYAQKIESPKPAAKPILPMKPIPATTTIQLDLKQLQNGLDGLGEFILTFEDFDFISEEQRQCIDELLLKTEGFLQGIKVATQATNP